MTTPSKTEVQARADAWADGLSDESLAVVLDLIATADVKLTSAREKATLQTAARRIAGELAPPCTCHPCPIHADPITQIDREPITITSTPLTDEEELEAEKPEPDDPTPPDYDEEPF